MRGHYWLYTIYALMVGFVMLIVIYTNKTDRVVSAIEHTQVLLSATDKTQTDELTRLRNRVKLLEAEWREHDRFREQIERLRIEVNFIHKRHASVDQMHRMEKAWNDPKHIIHDPSCMQCKPKGVNK